MKREIKFRVWDGEKMHYPDDTDGSYLIDQDGDLWHRTSYSFELVEDERVVVLWYTGMKDADGKKIYEGDIIRFRIATSLQVSDNGYDEEIGAVKMSHTGRWIIANDSWQFHMNDLYDEVLLYHYLEKTYGDVDDYLNGGAEIIGNIFQTPELLK